jgi:hypothetical protein
VQDVDVEAEHSERAVVEGEALHVTKLEHWVVVSGCVVYYLRRSKMEYKVSSLDLARFQTHALRQRGRSGITTVFTSPEALQTTEGVQGHFPPESLVDTDISPLLVWTCPIDRFRSVRNHGEDQHTVLLPLSARPVPGNILHVYDYPQLHHKRALHEVVACVRQQSPFAYQPPVFSPHSPQKPFWSNSPFSRSASFTFITPSPTKVRRFKTDVPKQADVPKRELEAHGSSSVMESVDPSPMQGVKCGGGGSARKVPHIESRQETKNNNKSEWIAEGLLEFELSTGPGTDFVQGGREAFSFLPSIHGIYAIHEFMPLP